MKGGKEGWDGMGAEGMERGEDEDTLGEHGGEWGQDRGEGGRGSKNSRRLEAEGVCERRATEEKRRQWKRDKEPEVGEEGELEREGEGRRGGYQLVGVACGLLCEPPKAEEEDDEDQNIQTAEPSDQQSALTVGAEFGVGSIDKRGGRLNRQNLRGRGEGWGEGEGRGGGRTVCRSSGLRLSASGREWSMG